MAESDAAGELLRAARGEGVLPQDARLGSTESRPWPVVLLTALGAWLAALPLFGVLGIFLRDIFSGPAGALVAGVLLLTASAIVLRRAEVPVFFEQLAVPVLAVGGAALGVGMVRILPGRAAAFVLCVVALGMARALPRPWLRVLLGAAAAGFGIAAALSELPWEGGGSGMVSTWMALHLALLAGLGASAVQERLRDRRSARLAAFVETVAAGWLLAVVAALAAWSGMTFLVGGSLGGGMVGEVARELSARPTLASVFMRMASVLCTVAAALLLARSWGGMRSARALLVAGVLCALAAFLNALGGVLLALAWLAVTHRWRLAAAAGLAAAWTVGAFYYQLQWPLATKAVVLLALGAILAAVAWPSRARGSGGMAASRSAAAVSSPQLSRAHRAMLLAASVIATLLVANVSIFRNEALIASGEKVFVRLAPVDPRSLMQGDYMRLDYSLPGPDRDEQLLTVQRPFVAVKRDARGVAQLLRIVRSREPLAPGEMLVELTPSNGRWTIVSDAWSFREGTAERWNAARYAEFRVMPDGRALLVGLADDTLRAIAP